jgi:hypothetical protein
MCSRALPLPQTGVQDIQTVTAICGRILHLTAAQLLFLSPESARTSHQPHGPYPFTLASSTILLLLTQRLELPPNIVHSYQSTLPFEAMTSACSVVVTVARIF